MDSDTRFSAACPVFTQDGGLVFVGYTKTTPRMGLIYCYNRPSALYYLPKPLEKSSVPEKLTDEHIALAPCFAPDFSKLAYFAINDPFLEHCRCLELKYFEWPKKAGPHVVVPTVGTPKAGEFPGISGFHDNFTSSRCGFLGDGVHYIFQTVAYGEEHVYIVNVLTGKRQRVMHPDFTATSQSVLCFKNNLLVLSHSSVHEPPYSVAVLLSLNPAKQDAVMESAQWCKFAVNAFDEQAGPIDALIHNTFKSLTMAKITTPTAEGYLHYSTGASGKRPLVVLLHGGPHSAFVNGYSHMLSMYILAGYAVLGVNYRGSLGYGQTYIESLLGQIGNYDVSDCADCIETACKQHVDVVDPACLLVSGGSHGGFLTASLIGRFPTRFKAAVARNPVVNVESLARTSDIPEWGFAEVLRKPLSNPASEAENTAMYLRSPIVNAESITTPLLLLLGGKDRRVPMSNGLELYNALKARGREVQVLFFPTDCHPLAEAETEVQNVLNTLQWFENHK